MLRWRSLSPFGLASFPVVHLAATNLTELEPATVLAPLAIALVATGAILALLRVACGDTERAAVMTSWLVVVFFGYGPSFEAVFGLGFFEQPATAHAVLLTLVAGAAAAGLGILWRRPVDVGPLASGLGVAAGLLLAFSVVLAWLGHDPVPRDFTAGGPGEVVLLAGAGTLPSEPLPDIYYIVLDGYPRRDVLARYYDFDDTGFIEALEARGFFVAKRAHANYTMTFLSLASTLGMRYLDDEIAALAAAGSTSRIPFYRLIQRPRVAETLKRAGYRYVHVPSGWIGTERSAIADVELAYAPILGRDFYQTLMRQTVLRPLAPDTAGAHRFAFEALAEIAAMDEPTFAFVHLLMPHPPFVFGRDGIVRRDVEASLQFVGDFRGRMGGWDDEEAFLDQLVYLNRRVLEAVDAIDAASMPRPIVVIQGDHGTARTDTTHRGGLHGPDPEERLPILSAARVPEAARWALRDDSTPVNTFRVILATLLGAELPRLPDRIFYSWYAEPYKLHDVTARMSLTPEP